MDEAGLGAVLLNNRDALLRFLRAHGAGDAAEDLLHELWLRLRNAPTGPLAEPLAYLYRAANNLMLDRYRAERQASARDRAWQETSAAAGSDAVEQRNAERILVARDTLVRAEAALARLGARAERAFRRHRIDGVPQRMVAAELGVSLSTVESDLRRATGALLELDADDQGSAASTPSKGRDDG